MSNKTETLWVVGGGNMGGALLARWCDAGSADEIVLIDPADVPVPYPAVKVDKAATAGPAPSILVLAVKPKHVVDVAAGLRDHITAETIVVSVIAGLSVGAMARLFPGARHVRAMPNTPTQVGKGVTGLYADNLDERSRAAIDTLFASTGDAYWLPDEGQFDALTAVSGSGPAYLFHMVEALCAAGTAAGLDEDMAGKLARATVIGAGALLDQDPRSARDLRVAVTSPGGTTQAGLEALTGDPGLPGAVRAAVRAAATRSREMATEIDA
ncbi:MAG: pyrroline-5-carboxylate reductase [Pseudomonadota bacterium]